MDDFDIGPDEIAMFMGMAEEMAEEERERLRIEKEFERSDEEESDIEYNHIQPEYSPSHPRRRPRRDPFMQWVWDLSHDKKALDDPLYGPPKPPKKGRRGRKEDYTTATILGVPVINAHLLSENFLRFIHIALHYCPKHEIDSIIFDHKGQPVVNGREVFGIFNASTGTIIINLRYHFYNAIHIFEHGHTDFSIPSIIWSSMIEVFLHELWHALDTIDDPDLIYPENKDIDDIATGWAKELKTFLAQNENIEPPKLTDDPYFGPRIIKYMNGIISGMNKTRAEEQRQMMVDGAYYRNTQAGINISTMKEFFVLSSKGFEGDEEGLRLNECVKKEKELDEESWLKEEVNELLIDEAIYKESLIKVDYVKFSGDIQKDRLIKPIRVYYKHGYGFVEACCEVKKAERTFRIDRIIKISSHS